MPIDRYSPCPGGTGKKIKFCCPDLVNELDKLDQLVAAEQRVACLEHIDQLERRFPDRACLCVTKANVCIELERYEQAIDAARGLLAVQPSNQAAWAALTLATLHRDGALAGVKTLQEAIASIEGDMSSELASNFTALGVTLLEEGEILAGRAHLETAAALFNNHPDQQLVVDLLTRVFASSEINPLFKANFPLATVDDTVAWKAEFDAAGDSAAELRWRDAADQYMALAERDSDESALWRNAAIMLGRVGESTAAAHAWRRFADLVPGDDAIEACALATMVDPAGTTEDESIAHIILQLHDIDHASSTLAASPLAMRTHTEKDARLQPPPRAVFALFDRPEATDPAATYAQLPVRLGSVLLFGRQTDREARVELFVREDLYDQMMATLKQIVGDVVGDELQREVVFARPQSDRLFEFNRRLPKDLTPEASLRLRHEQIHYGMHEAWMNMPFIDLGGQTPADVASDAAWRLVLEAKLLVLETMLGVQAVFADFPALRARLGLAEPALIDPAGINVRTMPPIRLPRLDLAPLSDDDIYFLFGKSLSFGLPTATLRFGEELLRRGFVDDPATLASIHQEISRVTPHLATALEHLHQAQQLAQQANQSPAPLYLAELPLALQNNQPDRFSELLGVLMTRHGNEPGIQRSLFQMLASLGLVDPNTGEMLMPAPKSEETGIVVPGGESGGGKLWTPDGDTASTGGKSALWTPGMD